VELTVKGMAFNQRTVWFELGPSLALWATGVLFSLSVSEQTQLRGAIEYKAVRKPSGVGFELDYNVRLPKDLEFTPKYLYLFVVVMTAWIIALLISQEVVRDFTVISRWSGEIQFLTFISLFLGAASVGIALSSLSEVSK
jgi:hypothetical protein